VVRRADQRPPPESLAEAVARSRRERRRRRSRLRLAIAASVVVVVAAGVAVTVGDGVFSAHLSKRRAVASPITAASTPPITDAPTTPTTTTAAPHGPGLALPSPPAPTPVALPATNRTPVFSRIPTPNKVIFLGIDDGIVRDPKVLDLLRQANIPFTMFLVQGDAHAGADYWKQAEQLGGVVESHTITHPDLTKVSYAQLQREVCGTLDDYQSLFGRRPTLFRPPYGAYNPNVQAVAASCGYKAIVLWKGSTNDGRFDLQEGPQLHPGDIVLMHWRTDLYANLQQVFQVCRQQGFAIASLDDYLR
jgi:peptidoglycan/xylan/chitin deacetylase (PgdA/CDA1 family)